MCGRGIPASVGARRRRHDRRAGCWVPLLVIDPQPAPTPEPASDGSPRPARPASRSRPGRSGWPASSVRLDIRRWPCGRAGKQRGPGR